MEKVCCAKRKPTWRNSKTNIRPIPCSPATVTALLIAREYHRHDVILKVLSTQTRRNLIAGSIVGDGTLIAVLKNLAKELKIQKTRSFYRTTPRNCLLPIQASNFAHLSSPQEYLQTTIWTMSPPCYPNKILQEIQSWYNTPQNGQFITLIPNVSRIIDLFWK
jgi:hypothetical protein